MKTIKTLCVVALASVACGGGRPPEFPQTFVSESQDEWLETHCESRGILTTSTAAFNDAMKNAEANFGEVVHYQGGMIGAAPISVKAFACKSRPIWYSRDTLETPDDL